jgi:hypothetical protein
MHAGPESGSLGRGEGGGGGCTSMIRIIPASIPSRIGPPAPAAASAAAAAAAAAARRRSSPCPPGAGAGPAGRVMIRCSGRRQGGAKMGQGVGVIWGGGRLDFRRRISGAIHARLWRVADRAHGACARMNLQERANARAWRAHARAWRAHARARTCEIALMVAGSTRRRMCVGRLAWLSITVDCDMSRMANT